MKPKADQEVDCAPKYMLLLMRWGILLVSIVTQGQSSEYDQAASLIEGFKADFVLADKGS